MNIWQPGENSWQGVVTKVIQKYLGVERRAGSDQFVRMKNDKPFEKILMDEDALTNFLEINVPIKRTFTIESLIGLLYSTSFCRRDYFKNDGHLRDFEVDIKAVVKDYFDGADTWTETYNATALLGIKA